MTRNILYSSCQFLSGLVAICLLSASLIYAQDRPRLTLEDIHYSSKFSGDSFRGGQWAADGPVVNYIESSNGHSDVVAYNLETEARSIVIDGSKLVAADTGELINIESYQMSPNGDKVLLYTDSERVWRQRTKGYYYILDLSTGSVRGLSPRGKGFQMFAKFSPGGDWVGFVRDRNIFLVDLNRGTETQLTLDGSEGAIINGTFDWVYEEEFGLRDGWNWSPDGSTIAFYKLDESATRDFFMTDNRSQYPQKEEFRYPKAGEANSEIRIGLISTESGNIRYLDTDTWNEGGDETEYIAGLGWTPELDGQHYVWMFRLNRDQNKLDLLYADPQTGESKVIIHEEEPTWIDVESTKLTYLDDGERMVWRSEVDGYDRLYLYQNNGTLIRTITSGDYDVTRFHGIDESTGTAFFSAALESPLTRDLYRISIDSDELPVRITDGDGRHSVSMSQDLRYFIDRYSNSTTPTTVNLFAANGTHIKTLESNTNLINLLATYRLPRQEFMTVPAADGTDLNAYIIKPTYFDETKSYPLLMYVYGGPGSQTVTNSWGGSRYLWHAYLAEEHGVLVASVDNRGTGSRGKAFKSATYKRLGELEAEDQIAAAKHFGSMPFVDEARIGIWGWSYGGYMTLMSMLTGNGPETFKTGISVAPVTDWRQYDTIYTERYMSTPQRNEEGYTISAPQEYADNMQDKQKLLIVHGDFDDNVHFQNAVQMADKLQQANKQFDFMMYPGKNHGIFGGKTRLHLHTMMTRYILDNLVGKNTEVKEDA